MHKRAKTSINVEVLANDKTYVPHETKTQRNALPCTACGNRGSRKSRGGASNGSSAAKAGVYGLVRRNCVYVSRKACEMQTGSHSGTRRLAIRMQIDEFVGLRAGKSKTA